MSIPLKKTFHFCLLFCLGILLISPNINVLANNVNLSSSQLINSASQLVEIGQKNYDLGEFLDAVKNLEQAAKLFASQGDLVNQAITLSNLSSAYQQLGEWEKAEKAIAFSLELLDYNGDSQISNFAAEKQNIIASVLNIYGHLWYGKGQADLALIYWQKTESIYHQLNNQQGIINSQINQVKALRNLGLSSQATSMLVKIQGELETLPLSLQAEVLRTLGEVLVTLGDFKNSEQFLQQSLLIAAEINSSEATAASLLGLANSYWAQGKLEVNRQNISTPYDKMPWQCQTIPLNQQAKSYYQKAQNTYQEVIQVLPLSSDAIKAKLSLFNLLVESGELTSAQQIWSTINLNKLPPTQTNIYGKINFTRQLTCLKQKLTNSSNLPTWSEIESILSQIQVEAEKLHHQRALSYAYGNKGSFYEYLSLENTTTNQLLITAQQLTQQALLLAQPSNAPDIAYQWQWQLGRIYARNGNQPEAISFYRDAVKTLKKVRNNLVAIPNEVQFSFRDQVEPIYRQLAKLLLSAQGDYPSQATLASAVNLIDDLQLAELENFLSCDLSYLATNSLTSSDLGKVAFIYPLILQNRLDVIYQLPQQPLQYHLNPIGRIEVENTVNKLQDAIARGMPEAFQFNSDKIYQWLIKPLETHLQSTTKIDTLVFVLDGYLRNIPMAVLYDTHNKEYLVEKDYGLAVLPTSQLFNLKPSSPQLKVLAAGISEALEVEKQKFTAINAEAELAQVKKLVTTETLLNSQFTPTTLQQKLQENDFSVLHLATHGNFSSNPEQTYIVAYEQLLRANDLNNLLRNNNRKSTLDLLILSACQSALGDNRATLGLAGLAFRAGAKSTLATVWQVSDQFTIRLITKFYEQLNQGVTKAEALHQAQKSLIYTEINGQKYQNEVSDWGAYILVGNWH